MDEQISAEKNDQQILETETFLISQNNLNNNDLQEQQKITQIQTDNNEQNIQLLKPIVYQNPIMVCSIHNKEISKVCMREECNERMFLCFDCAEDFSEHFINHKPFKDIGQFYDFIKNNPYSQRKTQIKKLMDNSKTLVQEMAELLENQKEKIVKEFIPELKLWFDEQCEELEQFLLRQVEDFSLIYQQNSHYMANYLVEKDLYAEIQNNVPDFEDVVNKFKEMENQPRNFENYLEIAYRKVYNVTSVELTRQAFNYFEELQSNFYQQKEKAPEYIGNDSVKNQIAQYFNKLKSDPSKQFTSFIAKFPICSKCNKQVDNNDHQIAYILDEQDLKKEEIIAQQQKTQTSQKEKQNNTLKNQSQTNSSKKKIYTQQNYDIQADIKQNSTNIQKSLQKLSKYIEQSSGNRPGKCRSCRRYYCLNCQLLGCNPCTVQWDLYFRTNKVVVCDNGTKAMFEEEKDKNSDLYPPFKKINYGFIISKQEFFAGKYEFDLTLENNDACHSIAFGVGKKKYILQYINEGWDLKDIKANDSLIMLNVQGQIYGGLKGTISKFQNERQTQFKLILNLDKGKLNIQSKQSQLEKVLNENNVGYCLVFYAQGSFKSYNSLSLKQYYGFENV